jgi:hypothetical protein
MSASPSTAATLIAGAAKAQRGAFDLADLIGAALRHFADVAAADARTRRAHAGEQAALTISAGLTADVDRLRAEVKVCMPRCSASTPRSSTSAASSRASWRATGDAAEALRGAGHLP